jgi:hypothetical protein
MNNSTENINNLDMEVIVSEEDIAVYVKLTGFNNLDTADEFALYLADKLPLLLFETDNIQ